MKQNSMRTGNRKKRYGAFTLVDGLGLMVDSPLV